MKRYAKGTHIVTLTDKAYETIYKDLGYLEIASSKYTREYLESLSFRGLYALYNREGLVNHKVAHLRESKEDIIRALELVEIRFNSSEEEVEQSVIDILDGGGSNESISE